MATMRERERTARGLHSDEHYAQPCSNRGTMTRSRGGSFRGIIVEWRGLRAIVSLSRSRVRDGIARGAETEWTVRARFRWSSIVGVC